LLQGGDQRKPLLPFPEAGKKRLAGDRAREATSDEVKDLKAEARQLKETLAEVLIENRGWGGRFMRYSASEKLEIIALVQRSPLSIRWTLAPIGPWRAVRPPAQADTAPAPRSHRAPRCG
jgi:hypothetical protein